MCIASISYFAFQLNLHSLVINSVVVIHYTLYSIFSCIICVFVL